jgi:hypothetical protein
MTVWQVEKGDSRTVRQGQSCDWEKCINYKHL